jgi:hypothetical protein
MDGARGVIVLDPTAWRFYFHPGAVLHHQRKDSPIGGIVLQQRDATGQPSAALSGPSTGCGRSPE